MFSNFWCIIAVPAAKNIGFQNISLYNPGHISLIPPTPLGSDCTVFCVPVMNGGIGDGGENDYCQWEVYSEWFYVVLGIGGQSFFGLDCRYWQSRWSNCRGCGFESQPSKMPVNVVHRTRGGKY